MSAVVIQPPKLIPYATQKVTFPEGVDYLVSFSWNERSGWYVGLATSEGDALFPPRRIREGRDLLASCTDSRRPPGRIILVDTLGLYGEASFDDLGDRYKLVYYTED